jgi:hypothetical protein
MRFYLSLAAIALACSANAASAATTVSIVSGTRGVSVLNGGPVAQTFVATDSLLTSFGFQFGTTSAAASSANVTFSLLSGGGLSGATLATSTASLTGLQLRANPSYTFYDVFTGGVTLTTGQTYTALLTTTSATLALIFGPNSTQTTDAYAAGGLIKDNSLDRSCQTGVCDANFRFTTTAAPTVAVPETSTWLMMLVGFGTLGASLRYRRGRTGVRFV